MTAEVLPFEIEKWLITIKAHCTVIADSPDDDIKVLAACIKINVDDELRPAILRALADLPSVKPDHVMVPVEQLKSILATLEGAHSLAKIGDAITSVWAMMEKTS